MTPAYWKDSSCGDCHYRIGDACYHGPTRHGVRFRTPDKAGDLLGGEDVITYVRACGQYEQQPTQPEGR